MADLKAIASQIRRDIVRMVHGAASGLMHFLIGSATFHPGRAGTFADRECGGRFPRAT